MGDQPCLKVTTDTGEHITGEMLRDSYVLGGMQTPILRFEGAKPLHDRAQNGSCDRHWNI
jgi:hypothetical protein